ncbi:hypothetical protein BU16DRAFT_566118 [Lophium mytilinum]|uniref:Uncharacterized protein n=1 Tax=Lophium mytilinum TaxID=390894 RepID=A0A6A6QFZ9_9PEZI|nr:hypothetical protein BU16DRAFT_566118 [Lophium mytilinum]
MTTTATSSPPEPLPRKETPPRTAKLSTTFPNFKKLPAELRNMVYKSLLSTHHKIKPSETWHTPLPGLAILQTDKQLHDEAHAVLAATAVATIAIKMYDNAALAATERNAISHFQHVRFRNICFGPRDLPSKHSASSTSLQLGRMLRQLNTRLVEFVGGSVGLEQGKKRYAVVDVRELFWVMELVISDEGGLEKIERIIKIRKRAVEEWLGCLWTMRGDEHTEWTIVVDGGVDAKRWEGVEGWDKVEEMYEAWGFTVEAV